MDITRRSLFLAAAPLPLSAQPVARHDIRAALRPTRLTIAMWDYSWLKSHYPGGPFENWDKTTDELLERQFNTVRIDAFPLLIGELKSPAEEVTLRADPLANWGFSDKDYKHVVAADLLEFLGIAKRKKLNVILSTWNPVSAERPETKARAAKDRGFYRECWTKTLDLLAGNGLLDAVLYVDLDQEFPYFSPYADQLKSLRRDDGPTQFDQSLARPAWTPEQLQYVEKLFKESLSFFQARYPALRFTYSLTSFFKEVRSMGLQLFDVLELHLWIHSPRFDNRTGFGALTKDRGPRSYREYAASLRKTMESIRPMLMQEMHNRLMFASEWSREIAAPLVTTEAWGPWWHMDHPDLDWQWLKDWCEESMGLASQYGFWGATPWNYSHPYWRNWSDVAWYRRVNGRFLRS